MGDNMELLKMLAPIIAIELVLKAFSFYKLATSKARYLPKWAWAIIIALVSGLGPIGFLIIGKEKY